MPLKIDYFKTFCKISKAFGTTAKLDELLKLIVDSVVESMNAKAACLFLADERQDVFVPTAQTGLSEKYLHANPMKALRIVAALEEKAIFIFPTPSPISVWKTTM